VLDVLARLLVPSFIVLTGVVLALKSALRPDEPSQFLQRRLTRIGIPWLVWAAVWMLVWMVIPPLRAGLSVEGPLDLIDDVLAGPGYLYFLLLILQLSLLFAFFPTHPVGRPVALMGGIVVQVAFTIFRVVDHGYELFPGWIGFFAAGVFFGSGGRQLLEPSGGRVLVCGIATALTAGGLVFTAGWNPERLDGANLFCTRFSSQQALVYSSWYVGPRTG
jgi:hypothetical protein